MDNAALQVETLQSAFTAFNHHSSLLETSYGKLKDQVTVLSEQLAVSQSERHQELLEKERLGSRMAWILEALPSAILLIDGNGFIIEHSSKAATLLDTPLLGCAWSVIVQREFCRGECADGELKLKNGQWMSLTRRSLAGEEGEVLILTDVTESRERTEMLQLHHRLSSIGEMTARLGHQFRTPLAAAMLYASQLDNPATAERRNIAGKITSRLQELAAMMDDMLRYASGSKQSGETVVVADLLKNVAETIRPQLTANTNLSIDEVSPQLVVSANKAALQGALLNLVSNAMQACNDEPRIELGAVRSGNEICLTVTDNGNGISDDIRSRIFDPFFTTRPQGTGLGLAVVRSVAEAHNGVVLVDSSPTGSTFAICLPCQGNVAELTGRASEGQVNPHV